MLSSAEGVTCLQTLSCLADKAGHRPLSAGLIYLQLGHTNDTSSVFDRLASLWLLLAVLAFTPCETACTLWDSERLLLRKEITSGTYSVDTFYLAKTLTTVPFQMACTTLYGEHG